MIAASAPLPPPVTPALRIRGLVAHYRGVMALDDITLEVAPGERIAIIGPNGAGKSTLLRCIVGLLRPSAGSIEIAGRRITRMRGEVAYLSQRSGVDGDYPAQVRDVVGLGRYPHLGPIRRPGPVDRQVIEEAIARVGLEHRATARLSELSGGLQQRTFLARVLAQQAPLVLLDELHAGLDIASVDVIDRELARLAAEGTAIMVVHHGLAGLVQRYDRLLVLRGGVVAFGPPDEILRPDILDAAYGQGAVLLGGGRHG